MPVKDLPGLRPTPERVRETLFNWIQHDIVDADCLDLFTGSGALGFEALSRGARKVIMVDSSPEVIAQCTENATLLEATGAELILGNAELLLPQWTAQFDIVFVDPPFANSVLADLLPLLSQCIKPGGFIYIETRKKASLPELPAGWEIIKSTTAGVVGAYLLQCKVGYDAPQS